MPLWNACSPAAERARSAFPFARRRNGRSGIGQSIISLGMFTADSLLVNTMRSQHRQNNR
jgi:hypothetical protein